MSRFCRAEFASRTAEADTENRRKLLRPRGFEPRPCGLEGKTRHVTTIYRRKSCILTELLAEEQTGVSQRHLVAPHPVDETPVAGNSPLPEAIAFLASVWFDLPPHVRETIITLATSCKQARMVEVCDDG